MADPRGSLKVTAGGKEYCLHLGMSVLADLQEKYGQDVLEKIEPPEGAGPNWLPEVRIIVDLFLGALQRHHADEADRFVVDDILLENASAFTSLMAAAFPDQAKARSGNVKRPKRAA